MTEKKKRGRKAGAARCDIALLVDAEAGERKSSGRFVPERSSVEAYLFEELRAQRLNVTVTPFDAAVDPVIAELRALKPRLVFNLTECVDGDRRQDAAIAGLLDLLRIPYTGTGLSGLRLARDKALSKHIVSDLGVGVPRHFVIPPKGPIRNPRVPYPLIVKPQFGDGSDEVRVNSLVKNERELVQRVRVLRRRVAAPLICEEFIEGRDLYVALLGNGPEVMPAVELVIGRRGRGAPTFASYKLKNDAAYRNRWRVRWRVAKLSRNLQRDVETASRAIFHALKLRDYGRVDYRLTPDGRIVFLEANANPDLHPHAMGNHLCFAGVEYGAAVKRIIAAAQERTVSKNINKNK
ncbi:MAG: ATP-grasp domain-containing protein [Burkholderiales bacterium]|nr:ATP-grasp domain-containing protein [Burkholderiales bacterium]